jgi:hypothetical protein
MFKGLLERPTKVVGAKAPTVVAVANAIAAENFIV